EDTALDTLWFGSVVDPASPELAHAIRLAGEASANLFAAASHPGQPLTLEGQPVSFIDEPDFSVIHATGWLRGYFENVLARNEAAIALLCGTPATMFQRSTTSEPRCRPLFVEAIQAFYMRQPRATDLLLRAQEATDPKVLDSNSVEWVLANDV